VYEQNSVDGFADFFSSIGSGLTKFGGAVSKGYTKIAPLAIKAAPKAIEGAGAIYALKMQKDIARMQQRTNELNAGAYGANPGYGYPAGDPPRQPYSTINVSTPYREPGGIQSNVATDFLSYKVGNTIPVWAIGAVVLTGLFILKNRR
jgi:hypothetical protein